VGGGFCGGFPHTPFYKSFRNAIASLCAQRDRLQPHILTIKRPYKGLETFGEDDAEFFFGRDDLVHDLLAKLKNAAFLAVIGLSGSG
jgi:hypothetical protein